MAFPKLMAPIQVIHWKAFIYQNHLNHLSPQLCIHLVPHHLIEISYPYFQTQARWPLASSILASKSPLVSFPNLLAEFAKVAVSLKLQQISSHLPVLDIEHF